MPRSPPLPCRFHALARLESVVVGGPGPVFTEEEATAVRAKVAAFGRQLDAVLYEGQSHFQTSTDPFKFTLQVSAHNPRNPVPCQRTPPCTLLH